MPTPGEQTKEDWAFRTFLQEPANLIAISGSFTGEYPNLLRTAPDHPSIQTVLAGNPGAQVRLLLFAFASPNSAKRKLSKLGRSSAKHQALDVVRATGGSPMPALLNRAALVHIRFDGRSTDVPFAELDIAGNAGESEIKRAVAGCLQIDERRLADYVLDRHPNGNLTIRPQAVFG
jgi:hypothetical protein